MEKIFSYWQQDRKRYLKMNLLVKKNYDMLLSLAERFTRDPSLARDLVHDVFLIFFENYDSYIRNDNPFEILVIILFREIDTLDEENNIQQTIANYTDTAPDLQDLKNEQILINTLDMRLHQAIKTLSRQQQDTIYLHYFKNKSYSEIASLLGTTSKTIKTQHFRALKKLFENMQIPTYRDKLPVYLSFAIAIIDLIKAISYFIH